MPAEAPIIVLGASGLLGRNLLWEGLARGLQARMIGVARDPSRVLRQVGEFKSLRWLDLFEWKSRLNDWIQGGSVPVVVNCIAIADNPACDRSPEQADKVNHLLALELGQYC